MSSKKCPCIPTQKSLCWFLCFSIPSRHRSCMLPVILKWELHKLNVYKRRYWQEYPSLMALSMQVHSSSHYQWLMTRNHHIHCSVNLARQNFTPSQQLLSVYTPGHALLQLQYPWSLYSLQLQHPSSLNSLQPPLHSPQSHFPSSRGLTPTAWSCWLHR